MHVVKMARPGTSIKFCTNWFLPSKLKTPENGIKKQYQPSKSIFRHYYGAEYIKYTFTTMARSLLSLSRSHTFGILHSYSDFFAHTRPLLLLCKNPILFSFYYRKKPAIKLMQNTKIVLLFINIQIHPISTTYMREKYAQPPHIHIHINGRYHHIYTQTVARTYVHRPIHAWYCITHLFYFYNEILRLFYINNINVQ